MSTEAIENTKVFGISPESDDAREAPKEGDVLGRRYLLMKRLSEGGTSLIYRARDMLAITGPNDEQSHVAIKVIKPEMAGYAEDLTFYETLTTRHLSHPNIVRVFDFHKENELSYVSMELLEGEPLSELLKRSPDGGIGRQKACRIFTEMCQALEYAHGEGVIHSDIKPSNVLILENGSVKVIDFATARSFIQVAAVGKSNVGEESSLYGYTLSYASPDIARSLEAAPADDVFSLACIFYEMLTGTHPFGRKASNELTDADKPTRPAGMNIWSWMVLRNALQVDRDKRIASVARFHRLWNASRRVWPGMAAGICAVALLGAGGVWVKGYVDQHLTHQSHLENAWSQQLASGEFVSRFEAMAAAQRLQHVSELDGVDAGLLQQVKPLFVAPLATAIDTALSFSEGDEIPDFQALTNEIDRVAAYFPDSLQLDQLRRQVTQRREQLVDLYSYQMAQSWSGIDYSAESASNILQAQVRLDELKATFPWDDAYLEGYLADVSRSVEQQDFYALAGLYDFAEALQQQYPQVKAVWGEYPQNEIDAGLAISRYLTGAVVDPSVAEYPDDAVRYFAGNELPNAMKAMSDAWLDREISAGWQRLDKIIQQYNMPPQSKLFQDMTGTAIRKLDSKLEYHKKRGFRDSYATMNKLKQSIVAAQNPVTNTIVEGDAS